ncbi:MAG: LCP family protein, partial [Acidimicrobiia bacterium]
MIRRHPIRAALVGLPLVMVLSFGTLIALWLAGVSVPGASASRWFTLTKTANADYTPSPTGPVFLLAIGNDGRTGDTVTRGDAIHLIGVNPQLHQATILDIPRDTGMNIPGHGVDKVNAAHTYGGPRLEADTIGATVGVKIPYVIDTDFDGFIGMIDDLGGLTVNVPTRMQDSFSGADFQPGPQKLDGHQALAYARNRHQFPTGDLARSENQGYLILQALAQFRAENTGPIKTLSLLADLGRHTTIDGIGLKDLYALGRVGLSIDPAGVKSVV